MTRKINEQKRTAPQRATARRRWLWISAVILIVVGLAGYAYYTRLPGPEAGDAGGGTPRLVVSPTVRNLGLIRMSQGRVKTEFTVENRGDGDLMITSLDTSCGCTSAALVQDGRQGPWFTMSGHGLNPRGWSATLRPGERAQLLVEYDPTAHGYYVGSVARLVYIRTNDPARPVVEARLQGQQVE